MKKFIVSLLIILLLTTAWGALRVTALMQGWLLTPWSETDDRNGFTDALNTTIKEQAKGNAVAALIEDGQIVHTYFYSKGESVDERSVFGVASVGKWVTAMGVMRLVEQGKLDLDTPVSTYLKSWTLPESNFDNDKVTLRLLLSHTAGIEDGLGHDGFAPNEEIQPLVEHLTQAADADPEVSGRVIVTQEPGSQWDYSGGSYNLIQLIIEDVSGMTFSDFMYEEIFAPLKLTNTQFQVDRNEPLLAQYYGENETLRVYPNYTSLAATGLYTNIIDMHKLLKANLNSTFRGDGFPNLLSEQSLSQMRAPIASVGGQYIWGAGVMLFAPAKEGYVVGHGGKSPFLNASVRFDPRSGSGFIMFQTGNDEAFASDIATQWTLWKTGKPDIYLVNNRIDLVVKDVLLGFVVIVILVIAFRIWQSKRKPLF